MKIALLTTTGGTHWLAGEPGTDEREFSSCADLDISAGIQRQTNAFIRAVAVEELDRGNLATTIGFSTTRKFATADLAEVFIADYDRTMPRTGTLMLHIPQVGGGVILRYLAGAVVEPPRRRIIGVSVTLGYTVHGGKITTSP